jgi:GT2 family glycosyltransferase
VIIIEICYSCTATPCSVGSDPLDHRLLSIGYRNISLHQKSKNVSSVCSDFEWIFGVYQNESWGRWSMGKRSCLVFPHAKPDRGKISISIDAHPFLEAFRSCRISVKTSTGYLGSKKITGKGPLMVDLRKPIIPRSKRTVLGDYSRIVTPLNLSHKDQLPEISIIILNHQKHLLTKLAVAAAASSQCSFPFEILCLDNGSSPESLDTLGKSEVPMRLIKLRDNKGFGAANNIAVAEARGKHLLFLNNDAFLDKGAVDEMVGVFKQLPDCGIVGSVLRYPDGTTQEAGATLQPDGHPVRHGRNDSKFNLRKLPRFKTVDYVSGACMMIRKSDFLAMGGFDEKYSPAYYEDTDLCMRSLLYGQKVYLATRANCYHIENATTSNIENGAWATRTAETQREIFLNDWGAYLATRDPKDLPWQLKK